ncbi:MAG: hypothetical protein A2W90_05960 [Bacteroidetes bacterium GWF2_42_66]|nr:MAG: hypothetical protein A2W92_01340 [Bacteroidetes bacterium GWA2_42_15]OFY03587.1 MAG: hypothetical protein A2W89_18685 [Bacteroidetes bacterium GWE2_42_39]OFY45952.1 MAG: hypothetical protein A2W90_05960 [Bacteroidetes bacterium GWF2_42_66]
MINRPAIILMYAEHKRVPVVTIAFDYHPAINRQLKTAVNTRCSSTLNCRAQEQQNNRNIYPCFDPKFTTNKIAIQ